MGGDSSIDRRTILKSLGGVSGIGLVGSAEASPGEAISKMGRKQFGDVGISYDVPEIGYNDISTHCEPPKYTTVDGEVVFLEESIPDKEGQAIANRTTLVGGARIEGGSGAPLPRQGAHFLPLTIDEHSLGLEEAVTLADDAEPTNPAASFAGKDFVVDSGDREITISPGEQQSVALPEERLRIVRWSEEKVVIDPDNYPDAIPGEPPTGSKVEPEPVEVNVTPTVRARNFGRIQANVARNILEAPR